MKRTKRIAPLLLAALMTLSLAACGGSTGGISGANDIYPDDEGYANGRMEDVMHTYFFDYTVNSAYLCEQYESYVPKDGYDLLVADVTIKNTHTETITMFDTDFQVQWNSEAEDAFDVPITYYMDVTETISNDVLPYEYELKVNKSRTGLLIFEVPEGEGDFSISYLEYFDDDSTGDVFFVYFSADKENVE